MRNRSELRRDHERAFGRGIARAIGSTLAGMARLGGISYLRARLRPGLQFVKMRAADETLHPLELERAPHTVCLLANRPRAEERA